MANAEQLALLKKCSAAYDFTEWNTWRKADASFRPDLREANLVGACLIGATLVEKESDEGRSLTLAPIYADLGGADFIKADLTNADLTGADLRGADFTEADLTSADLTGADSAGADLREAILEEANLERVDLRQMNIDESTRVAPRWRLIWQIVNVKANLQALDNQDLHDANLAGVGLTGANLREANLRGADLTGANLTRANLTGANLTRANLTRANLTGASLTETNFSGANLTGAIFSGAMLDAEADWLEANLTGAYLDSTIFANVDLSQVKGLAAVNHENYSTLGIDTLYKSGGNIPEAFLRGCGVPDAMIAFAKSLAGKSH
ncbi:MAG: pentapeptide repeat-containing protein [Anaerolineae bacterium]